MAPSVTVAIQILMFLHVGAAVAWVGAALFTAAVLFPTMWRMDPEERARFYGRIMPRLGPYMLVCSVLTLLFGGVLAYELAGGNLSVFIAPGGSAWAAWVTFGGVFGIAAFLVGEVYILPSALRLAKIVTRALANPSKERWSEIDAFGHRLDRVATASLALFALALIGMAGAASV